MLHPNLSHVFARLPKTITMRHPEDCLEFVFPLNSCMTQPNVFPYLSQNEDCGQMSAWYLFSALGFYPVDPVSGDYIVGTYVHRLFNVELARLYH